MTIYHCIIYFTSIIIVTSITVVTTPLLFFENSPWCHRIGIAKALYGISDNLLGVTELIDDPTRASRGGWIIGKDKPAQIDPVFGAKDLKEVYNQIIPDYEGLQS